MTHVCFSFSHHKIAWRASWLKPPPWRCRFVPGSWCVWMQRRRAQGCPTHPRSVWGNREEQTCHPARRNIHLGRKKSDGLEYSSSPVCQTSSCWYKIHNKFSYFWPGWKEIDTLWASHVFLQFLTQNFPPQSSYWGRRNHLKHERSHDMNISLHQGC